MPTFNYASASFQTYVVPAGVNYLRTRCHGAQGADYNNMGGSGGAGGRGAIIEAIHRATPGETIYVIAGQKADSSFNNIPTEDVETKRAPWGGGGPIRRFRSGYTYGNEGGGYSSIRRGGNAHANTVLMAGGGGGKGQVNSGTNPSGGDAGPANGTAGGGGGSGAGGAATISAGGGAGGGGDSTAQTGGGSGAGGTGGFAGNFTSGGAGGGGGWYGGGGGSAHSTGGWGGGGGGGSSYFNTALGRITVNNVAASGRTGQGAVIIDPYVTPTPTVSFPVTPHVAPRYAFQVGIVDPHPLSTGTRTVTYQISKDSTFATGVIERTVNFVANSSDQKIASDPAIASVAGNLHMNFWVALLDAGTWYVRVKTGGDNSLSDSAWSTTASWVVTAYTPPAPLLAFPVSPASNRRFAFSVDIRTLHPLAGGTRSVVYELSENADFSSPTTATVPFVANQDVGATVDDPAIADVSSGFVQNFWRTLAGQGTWHLRAKVIGDQGLEDTAWTATTFTSSHAPAASVVSPTGGTYVVYSPTTTFRINATDPWPADKMTAYQLVVERNDTGAVIVDTGKMPFADPPAVGQINLSQAIDAAQKSNLLRWRARVWDSTDVASPYSNYSLFTLVDPPAVGVTAPTEGEQLTSGVPNFAWSVGLTAGRTIVSSTIVVREAATNAVIWQRTTGAGITAVTPETTILINNVSYSVTVTVLDSAGLTGTDSNLFSTSYVSPDPILYTVDASGVADLGYVEVNWSNQAPDARLIAWRVYRRALPNVNWELMEEIPNEAIKVWRDYLVESGRSYMYTVSQLADRSGAVLESPVGTRFTQDGPEAEGQVEQTLIDNYWIIVPDQPELSVLLPNVTAAGETEEYDQAVYTIINRGRHVDYGDRLGYSGSLTVQIRQPERESLLKARIELLRQVQETYYLRTPFGRLFPIALGNLGWEPKSGTGYMEMGDMTIPYFEVA